jgi:hypothetical protein
MSTSRGDSNGRRSTTSRSSVATFADVRRIAVALPQVDELLTWGTDVTFRVGKKIFAIGGDDADHVSIKAGLERQAELIELDPATFAPAPYVGRYGWLSVDLGRIDESTLELLLMEAWRMTAPKRLVRSIQA